MLAPKKVKHRKMHKGRMRGKAYRGGAVTLGEYGLKALEPGWITNRQIETRMGKGKGNPEYWVASVRPGRILYEMDGVTPEVAREALRLAAHKLPIATRFVERGRI